MGGLTILYLDCDEFPQCDHVSRQQIVMNVSEGALYYKPSSEEDVGYFQPSGGLWLILSVPLDFKNIFLIISRL